MDRLLKTTEKKEVEEEFSFKKLFVPLTTLKAIHWLIFTGFIVYFISFFNGFVWDDITYIIFNTDIHSFDLTKIFGSSLFNDGVYYRPITSLYFTFSYLLFNTTAFYYHFIGVLIHIINSILLFLIFKRLFDLKISFFLTLVFLLHPIQVESVTYISATDNLIFFTFGIIAFFLSLKKSISKNKLLLIFIFLILSIFTKETGILFIFIILLYRLIFKKNKIIVFITSSSLTIISYILIRFLALGVFHIKPNIEPIAELSFFSRLINIPAIVYYYLKTTFFPLNLAIDQQWVVTKINFSLFYLPLILDSMFVFIIILVGYSLYKNNKNAFHTYLFFSLWFILGSCLLLQIIPLEMTVADRWFYFPLVGLLGMLGSLLSIIQPLKSKKLVLISSIFITVVILLSIRTVSRIADWQDGLSLYSHDSKVSDNAEIEDNLANQYASIKNFSEAKKHWDISIAMRPSESTYYNMAFGYEQMGNLKKAKEYFYKALNTRLYYVTSHKHLLATYVNLGEILVLTETPEKAINLLNIGLKDYPDSADLWYLMAISEYKINNKSDALSAIINAKELSNNAQYDQAYYQIQNNKPIQLNNGNNTFSEIK